MANRARKEPFDKWVSRMGGEMLAPTNSYETHRFKAGDTTCVVYKSIKRGFSFSSARCEEIWRAYSAGSDAPFHKPGRDWLRGEPMRRALIERDGGSCFYCTAEFTAENPPTIEHLVARIHKGPDHISNKFLACEPCNREAGHLSAPEKIRMREKKREEALR